MGRTEVMNGAAREADGGGAGEKGHLGTQRRNRDGGTPRPGSDRDGVVGTVTQVET